LNTLLDISNTSLIWIEFDHDWRTIQAADEAYVEMSLDGGVTWTEVVSWIGIDDRDNHVISMSLSTGCSSNVKFRFRVIQPGWDWWWAVDNFVVYNANWPCAPNPPSNLVAIANAPGQVTLNWQDNSNDESYFHIQRKLGDSLSTNQYNWIGATNENITIYIDTTVSDTTFYTYKVHSDNGYGGWSAPSNQAEVLTLIPVELTSFSGNEIDGKVQLKWATATETNNLGFEIYRNNQNDEQSWKKIGFVQGHGTTTEPQSYSFMDESILSGAYQYRLKQIDYDGSYEYSNIIEVEVGIPTKFSLEQNYPNPFNPTTTIYYSLPELSNVVLKVYDVLGNEITTLVNEEKQPGNYEVEFNGENLASGIYVYKLQARNFVEIKKMVLMK